MDHLQSLGGGPTGMNFSTARAFAPVLARQVLGLDCAVGKGDLKSQDGEALNLLTDWAC